MEPQERIGTWCTWGIILLSWIGFFPVLALMFRATGCNRSSEAGTQGMDVVAESVGFEARSKNGPLQPVQQSSLSSQPVSSFGSKRRDRSLATGPGYPRRDSWPGGRPVEVKEILWSRLQAERELQEKYNESSRE